MNANDTKARGGSVRKLRELFSALVFSALSLPTARAEDVVLSPGGRNLPGSAIAITVPDTWDSRDLDGDFFHAATPDKAVWFTAMIFDRKLPPRQLAEWLPGHWKEFGIETRVDFSKLQPAKAHVAGRPATVYAMEGIFSYAGDIENVNGRMGMSVVEMEAGTLVFTWGGEPAKCDQHLDAIVKVMHSIRTKTEATKR